MNHQSASHLQFLKGQEICQIAFGMYDLQFNWVMVAFRAPDGSPTHRAKVAKLSGPRAIHSMQYQCCVCYSRPSKLVMARRKEK